MVEFPKESTVRLLLQEASKESKDYFRIILASTGFVVKECDPKSAILIALCINSLMDAKIDVTVKNNNAQPEPFESDKVIKSLKDLANSQQNKANTSIAEEDDSVRKSNLVEFYFAYFLQQFKEFAYPFSQLLRRLHRNNIRNFINCADKVKVRWVSV